jgi:hypothetical protein
LTKAGKAKPRADVPAEQVAPLATELERVFWLPGKPPAVSPTEDAGSA